MPKITNPLKPMKISPVSPQWVEGKTREEVLDAGLDFMQSTTDKKAAMRAAAVRMFFDGKMQVNELAAHYKVHRCTVSAWIRDVKIYGYNSLIGNTAGRHPALDNEISEKLKYIILNEHPSKYGLKSWSSLNLSLLLKNEFDIEHSVRSCARMLNYFGIDNIKEFNKRFEQKELKNKDVSKDISSEEQVEIPDSKKTHS